MSSYRCPLCLKEMPRDLVVYLDHTQQHIIDRIKQEHPEWIEVDGVCKPCTEYFRMQISGGIAGGNIGPNERQKRFVMGIGMLIFSLLLVFLMQRLGVNQGMRLFLFVPVFFAMLGLIQAREKTCALLAERGLRNMDRGENSIGDDKVACLLRARGRLILFKSALGAAILTATFFLFP